MSVARSLSNPDHYAKLRQIDGRHPLQSRVPGGSVLYRVRRRKHGRVVFFNFALAKEMGLLAQDHPHKITRGLKSAILDTFAIQIINEHDIIEGVHFPKDDIKSYPYMATRYLQLQHPNKSGLTSGDGRSIWNGFVDHRGKSWDVSSCGTGATCLSPATAIQGKFFATGDPSVSYGCGFSEVAEGIGNTLFSEIFHKNGIRTERTLAVIEFPGGMSINVRAGQNLLRPSHMFNHLKQEHYERLEAVVNLFIDRQIRNGDFPEKKPANAQRYNLLLDFVVERFAEITARFETDYIFCWLDWDGDNILADGGIIDYGSIRQFGLFHHAYRFDDVERWSTTITEQKLKARYTVQTFIQLVDYLKTKKRKPVANFRKHKLLKRFDATFIAKRDEFFLIRLGFNKKQADFLRVQQKRLVKKFQQAFNVFERATSVKGEIRMEDGITKNAIFCMRDIMRELPHYLVKHATLMDAETFIKVLASNYATKADLEVTSYRRRVIKNYQEAFLGLIDALTTTRTSRNQVLSELITRSDIINRRERVTGDAIIHITDRIVKKKDTLTQDQLQKVIDGFIEDQVLNPEHREIPLSAEPQVPHSTKKLMHNMLKIVRAYREGL